ncbi:MAG: TlpA disulfide reductase family protein [bacterium]|nr:TlpA disulfide reductase family protein [bacterium]
MLLVGWVVLPQSDQNKIPSVVVKTLDGNAIRTETISNNKKPIILCFWATWCRSSIKELDAISEQYADWQKETGVKLVAVSFDDARSLARVTTMVKTKGWDYENYVDANQEFKRAMNVNLCPHTFLIDNSGNIVWQSTSYLNGSEDELFELVKKLALGLKIDQK